MSLDSVLDTCLQDIQTGKATVDECLSRYPDMASELEPLLRLAERLTAVPALQPSSHFVRTTRAQLLKLRPPETVPLAVRLGRSLRGWLSDLLIPWQTWQWRRVFLGAMAVFVALFLIAGGTVAASAESLPDHPLYPVKRAVESARLLLAVSPESKAMLHVEFAGRRLNEAMAVAQKGQADQAKDLIQQYGSELLSALVTLEQAAAQGTSISNVSFELRGRVAGQQTTVESAGSALSSDALNSALGVARQVDVALAELTESYPGDLALPERPPGLPSSTPTPTLEPKIGVPVSSPRPTQVPPTERPQTELPRATPSLLVLPTRTPEPHTEPLKLTPIILGATATPAPPTATPRPPTPTASEIPTQAPPTSTPTARPATPTSSPLSPTPTPRGPTPTEVTPTPQPPPTYETPAPRPPTPTSATEPPAAPTTSPSPPAGSAATPQP